VRTTARTRDASLARAHTTASAPTAPSPMTATVSPSFTPALVTACKAHAIGSARTAAVRGQLVGDAVDERLRRQHQPFREAAGEGRAEVTPLRAQVGMAGPAVPAPPARDLHLHGEPLARAGVTAPDLVTGHERPADLPRAGTVPEHPVGRANTGGFHLDQP
jgi:hypothetical protein